MPAAGLALSLAACATGNQRSATEPSTGTSLAPDSAIESAEFAPGDAAVTIRLLAYRPKSLTVKPGTTVTWTQRDPGEHTVTSGIVKASASGADLAPDGLFDSGGLATDTAWTRTFDEAGIYPYYCSLHPATMTGEVVVR